ncbi:DnaJ domain [Pseudocohnilembus persalinus]|uniref:DnaJ domain n=1 Tax=Pseudocohnilembus persalinus TaxID=266149 RepID=A0A0V0QNP6_PSEPJ|nr:DnaJ domain [Pseudocohnilembus persalinus]|eukprot:KRX03886.1 DnaJ domain [Pseudocohnilembus persalinus]
MVKKLRKKSQIKTEETQKKHNKKNKQEEQKEQNQDSQQEDQQEQENGILYKLLNVEKDASQEQINKAYRTLSLQLHPDKNPEPEAKQKFMKIKDAYNILKDPKKREIYDRTGQYGDNFDSQDFNAAYEYFRNLYKPVKEEDIREFEKKYKNSKEEEQDLIDYYNKQKYIILLFYLQTKLIRQQGDITLILENIILSENEDVDRFVKFYEEQIKQKNIKKFVKFDITKKKIRLLQDESEEVKEALKDLQSQILVRNQDRLDSLLAALEDKYAKPKREKKNKTKTTQKKQKNEVQDKKKKKN